MVKVNQFNLLKHGISPNISNKDHLFIADRHLTVINVPLVSAFQIKTDNTLSDGSAKIRLKEQI